MQNAWCSIINQTGATVLESPGGKVYKCIVITYAIWSWDPNRKTWTVMQSYHTNGCKDRCGRFTEWPTSIHIIKKKKILKSPERMHFYAVLSLMETKTMFKLYYKYIRLES